VCPGSPRNELYEKVRAPDDLTPLRTSFDSPMLIAIWSPGMVASTAIKMPTVEMSYRKLGSSEKSENKSIRESRVEGTGGMQKNVRSVDHEL